VAVVVANHVCAACEQCVRDRRHNVRRRGRVAVARVHRMFGLIAGAPKAGEVSAARIHAVCMLAEREVVLPCWCWCCQWVQRTQLDAQNACVVTARRTCYRRRARRALRRLRGSLRYRGDVDRGGPAAAGAACLRALVLRVRVHAHTPPSQRRCLPENRSKLI
jgi:hypothetical protein